MNTNTDLVEKEALVRTNGPRTWNLVLDRRLPDLRVLYNGETVLGFVYKLADTPTGVSQWCCNIGCGDTAKLVGYNWTLDQAKLCVEEYDTLKSQRDGLLSACKLAQITPVNAHTASISIISFDAIANEVSRIDASNLNVHKVSTNGGDATGFCTGAWGRERNHLKEHLAHVIAIANARYCGHCDMGYKEDDCTCGNYAQFDASNLNTQAANTAEFNPKSDQ